MTDPNKPNLPVPSAPTGLDRLDRAAVERVLARAAELQASGSDAPEGLSEAQLVELAREVGISPEHMRQALAEERTRIAVPDEGRGGAIGAWFGANRVAAQRTVRGTPATVLSTLDAWMQREELLRPLRRYTDRLTWEARRDFLGSIQSGFNFSGRPFGLTPANEVGATAVAIDHDRVLVRLDADFSQSRQRSVAWSAATGGLGALSAGGLIAVASLFPGGDLAIAALGSGVLAAAGGGVATLVARAQQRKLTRAQLALEQILDRLEHGELRTKGVGSLLDFLTPGRR